MFNKKYKLKIKQLESEICFNKRTILHLNEILNEKRKYINALEKVVEEYSKHKKLIYKERIENCLKYISDDGHDINEVCHILRGVKDERK